jgi:3-carboxy-cis,cis-muconate cycloisomerase
VPSLIQARMASTADMVAVFDDAALITHALAFESALARAEADCDVIPASAAAAIAKAAATMHIEPASLGQMAAHGGTLAIPLVRQLGKEVAAFDKAAAGYVHFGGTSQDLADTALMLQLKAACALLTRDLARLANALAALAGRHRGTVMLARTLMQPALPTTFGAKAASWLIAIEEGLARLVRERDRALKLQFGGAAGTLSALGEKGIAVGRRLAAILELPLPAMPWHTRRDGIAGLAAAAGILTGSLGKMARDISLLAQPEIGEVREPAGEGRGGSSTLPHKRNPVASMTALAAATRTPGLVAAMLAAMVQENERALGGWQAEAPTISALFEAAHGATLAMVEAIEGLDVDSVAMARNLEHLDGLVLAERLLLALAPRMGRNEAHGLVEELSKSAATSNRQLGELAMTDARITAHLSPIIIETLFDPAGYLGATSDFTRNALALHERARAARES